MVDGRATQAEKAESLESETVIGSELLNSEWPIQNLRFLLQPKQEAFEASVPPNLVRRIVVARNKEDRANGQSVKCPSLTCFVLR